MRLMNIEHNVRQPSYQKDVKGHMEPQLNDRAREFYSQGLCALVDQCVRFRTYHRIKLPDLWDRIQRYTGVADTEYNPDDDGDDEGRFDDMQNVIYEKKYGDNDKDDHLEYPEEEYKIGLAGNKDEGQGNGRQGNEDLDDDDEGDGGLGGIDDNLSDIFPDDEDLVEDHGGRVYPGGRDNDPDI
jgi:hypothetical protein